MVLSFTDVLHKAGIDPAKTKLIRHALTDRGFKECYDCGKVYEYTCHQKPGVSKGYDYWAVFISGRTLVPVTNVREVCLISGDN